MIENKEIAEAIDRIARTPDGQVLYLFLQKVRLSITDDPSEGALRQHEGRRRFAAELMAYMAEGIQDSDRHAITFARAKPRSDAGAKSRPRGAARRITDRTFVSGWDGPDTGPDPVASTDTGPDSPGGGSAA
jgi:hypothetical protein